MREFTSAHVWLCGRERQLTGPQERVSTAQLSASPTEKDEFDIPDLTDNSRRQLFRTKSKRRFFFRVSEEQQKQQRRYACTTPGLRLGGVKGGWSLATNSLRLLLPQGDAKGPLCALQAHLTAYQLQPPGTRGPCQRAARRQGHVPG